MWASVIAVAGTLLGGLLTSVAHARTAQAARRETRAADQRASALGAVTALLAAVADHRRARWVREELRLNGADEAAMATAREATHTTRSAITAPLATVCVLLPALADPAEAAVQASYAMRNTPGLAALEALRAASVTAEKQLRQAASRVFAVERCGRRGNIT